MVRSKIEVLESNLEDHTPEFDPKASYAIGDVVRVSESKMLYTCIKAVESNANLREHFVSKGADNTMAALDSALNSVSVAKGVIKLKIQTQGFLFLSNFKSDTLSVRLWVNNELAKEDLRIAGVDLPNTYILEESAALLPCIYEIELRSAGIVSTESEGNVSIDTRGEVSLGLLFVGLFKEIGPTLYNGTISVEDFSKISVDEAGLTQINLGPYRKTYKFSVLIALKDLDEILSILCANKSIPSVIELSDALECLCFLGLIRSIDVSFKDSQKITLDLELEELT